MTDRTPCPVCQGMGWILRDEGGRPVARRCECSIERQKSALFDAARIPRRYEKCSLQNFEIHNDSHKDALKHARNFVKDYPGQKVGLLFIGPCGVGKTHLAVAVLRELIEKKWVTGIFYDFRDLVREIQHAYSPDSVLSESEILSPIFNSEVLVLDELGATRTSEWVEETIFYVINHRYNNGKLTIFTTNYLDLSDENEELSSFKKEPFYKNRKKSMEESESDPLVKRIGVRLRSRIYEMCFFIDMRGQDYRKNFKNAGYRL